MHKEYLGGFDLLSLLTQYCLLYLEIIGSSIYYCPRWLLEFGFES